MNWKNRIVGYGQMNPVDIVKNPLNHREHSEYQHKVMRGILDDIGWIQGVLVNKTTGRLIDGHMRLEDALMNEEESIPVVYVELSEEEEKKALAVYDPVGTLAKFNRERLESIITDVQLSSATVSDMIRTIAKKNKIDMSRYTDSGLTPAIDNTQRDIIEFDVATGDIFEIINPVNGNKHRLMCGDSSDDEVYQTVLNGVKPILAVTSPPYNQKIDKFKPSGMQVEHTGFVDRMSTSYEDSMDEDEYQEKQIEMINRICDNLDANGSLFYNHKIRYRDKRILSPIEWISKTKYPIRQEIIWDRGGSVTLNARMFIPCEERIYWIRKSDNFVFNDESEIKSWSNIWRFGAKNDVKVSAAFPYELPYRCIIACTSPGDAVIDPYSGSGTSIAAANRNNRRGYGIEISPLYVKESLNRFQKDGLLVSKVRI